MPEMPEVETIRRALETYVVGRRVVGIRVRDGKLRQPVNAARLRRYSQGRRLVGVRRRSKYLLVDLEDDGVTLIHLGMTGRLSLVPHTTPFAKHDRVAWLLDDDQALRFCDPRRFGLVDAFAAARERSHPRLRNLGIEPLSASFDADTMRDLARGLRVPIKSFLMDAKRVVGVGNIYACESLFVAGIHPTRRAGGLSRERWQRLVHAVRRTLGQAIDHGGTTLQDFAGLSGETGFFALRLKAYGREGEPCRRCQGPIRRIVQSGRSTFYCPGCQH